MEADKELGEQTRPCNYYGGAREEYNKRVEIILKKYEIESRELSQNHLLEAKKIGAVSPFCGTSPSIYNISS